MASSRRGVVAIPFPGRGHINPMMVLARQLIARSVHVTFILTEEWLGLINSAHPLPPPELKIMTIPNCIPSESGRGKDHPGFIKAVYTKMGEPFEELLDRLEPTPQAIIADTYLPWAVEVGNRRGIPVCSLFTMPAVFFSVLLHFERIPPPENPHSPVREYGDCTRIITKSYTDFLQCRILGCRNVPSFANGYLSVCNYQQSTRIST